MRERAVSIPQFASPPFMGPYERKESSNSESAVKVEIEIGVETRERGPRTSAAPDLHLLLASKVFAVEGRFMAGHGGMLLLQEEIVVVRTWKRRVVRPSFATTEAVAATRPLASGIKWDFTGAWTATALRRIPRWRKRQLRNAKPPPCCCSSARFTSELRVASEPCESRESTSWRSSIGNWENIAIGEANLRNEILHVCRQLNTKRSVKDDNEWTKMGSSSVVHKIQNPKPVKDRLTQEQSSSRGIARNRKWRRKADKGRGNRKPSLPSESETIRGFRSKIVCQMREEQTGVTRRNHRRSTSFGELLFICITANRQRLAVMSPIQERREHDVLVDDGKCVSNPGAQGDPQANYPTIILALNVQDRAIRVTLFIPRFRI
ncbi:hypothetical protein ALC53_13467 [Atta colombica]|uniref:Uncharacterized protein n=1 Tax=Atta colombica TaxID=520822 RepID=A0A195AV99_9HYME|nr:hypothetical protein ALC53_13467 [Atta colombica]